MLEYILAHLLQLAKLGPLLITRISAWLDPYESSVKRTIIMNVPCSKSAAESASKELKRWPVRGIAHEADIALLAEKDCPITAGGLQ